MPIRLPHLPRPLVPCLASPLILCSKDYCIVAFAIVLIISTFQWFIDGRKNFKGPQIEEAVLQVDDNTMTNVKAEDEEMVKEAEG